MVSLAGLGESCCCRCAIVNDLETRLSPVRTSKSTGVMFLCEVALGKEHTIIKDNSSLKKAPAGFDSVVARGLVEPGPTLPLIHVTS